MQIIWDHTFGKQETQDLVVCKPMALVHDNEEDEALDNGWLALDEPIGSREVFYQSRSTRINLSRYRPRFKQPNYKGRPIGYKIIDASEMVRLLALPHIYKKYLARKGFPNLYDPFQHYHKRDQFMVFYIDRADNIVGFTKQKRYSYGDQGNLSIDSIDTMQCSGIESVIHANTIPIGAECLEVELMWAHNNSVPHYYLGSGYEQSSEYKASWRGFEWWTGTEWSSNKKQYRRLCKRDSRITEFSALGNLSLIQDKL